MRVGGAERRRVPGGVAEAGLGCAGPRSPAGWHMAPPHPALAGRGPTVRSRPRRGALPAAAGRVGRQPAAGAALTFPVFEAPSPRGGGRDPAPAFTG